MAARTFGHAKSGWRTGGVLATLLVAACIVAPSSGATSRQAPASVRPAPTRAGSVNRAHLGTVQAARRAADALRAQPDSGSIALRAARIALTQVGVGDTPVSHTFRLDCDPYTPIDGPTIPNSDGCGYDSSYNVEDQNETWCADFLKWVWKRAGVDNDLNTINAGAVSVYGWGHDQGEDMPIDPTNPRVGDAVVFFPPGPVSIDGFADHVGIITAVHQDGTIDMVNGDFLGPDNITVQYNTNLDLSTWASQVWSNGEQWVFVSPPQSEPVAAPTVQVRGPKLAVTSTAVQFSARATTPKGRIASYFWSFGDGGSATGAHPVHVFRNPGWQTVTVTATSTRNTVNMAHLSIDVVGSSRTSATTPAGAHYYTTQPVHQQLFLLSDSGALTQEYYNGSSWSDTTLPGTPATGSDLAALNFANADWQPTQHVYFRDTSGALAETTGDGTNWATATIAGSPAAHSPIVAALDTSGSTLQPDVFYLDTQDRLAESSLAGSWTTRTVPGKVATTSPLAVTDYVHGGTAEIKVFDLTPSGHLAVDTWTGSTWQHAAIRGALTPASTTGLAVLPSGTDGAQLQLFFVDTAGRLAHAVYRDGGWSMQQLPGTPASGGRLFAANYLSPSGDLNPQVYFLTPNGDPADTHATSGSGRWITGTLGGVATRLLGAEAYPDGVQGQQFFMAENSDVYDNAYTPVNGTWYPAPLPGTAAP